MPPRTDVCAVGIFLKNNASFSHIPVTLNKDKKCLIYSILIFSNKAQCLFQALSVSFDLVHGLQLQLMADHPEWAVLHSIKTTCKTVICVPVTLRKLKLQVLRQSVIGSVPFDGLSALSMMLMCTIGKLNHTSDYCECSWEVLGLSQQQTDYSLLCFADEGVDEFLNVF